MNTDLKISDRAISPENEEASSSLEARALAKWSCSACTYQNWPKSFKCIMCGKIFLFLGSYITLYFYYWIFN